MQQLNAATVPLCGTNLIEASAGTGKTWTLSWLYLRLVAVSGLQVGQILVVTYTEAATAELRDRIRKRLADALAYLEGRASSEAYPSLLEEAERDLCCQRLQLALVSFDEAAVFTIHGFCKRVLSENAFEARLPFEHELVTNEDDLLTELSDQFWYQHFLQPDALHLALLREYKLTPDSLLDSVRQFIGKPYLQAQIPLLDASSFIEQQQAYQQALQHCAQLWQEQRSDIVALLHTAISNKVLNGSSYKLADLPKWQASLDKVMANQPITEDDAKMLEKLCASKLKANKDKTPPQHAFFTALDALAAARAAFNTLLPQALENLRLQLLHFLRRELPQRKQQQGILSFDDLLLHLRNALAEHANLAPRLAKQYQAALIDEFQDTDPIQYDIFQRIYQNTEQPVFYVGDPKQAIYGFRGADIYTYLRAAAAAQQRYTLGDNYRSHAALLEALNYLFSQSPDPFRSQIRYECVNAGREQAQAILPAADGTLLPAVRLWDWAALSAGYNKEAVQDQIAAATANDIARLLNAAQAGEARIGTRPLLSSDIAILVRTNRQGELLKQELLKRGIASVQKSTDNIFTSREAHELRSVLRAIAEPNNEAALKQALVTELFGYDAARLYALETDTAALETCLETFHAWHKTWQNQGFMPMFRQLMQHDNRYSHLLAFADGERRLTNFLHLAELIHTENRLHGHGMHALIRWLQQRAQAALKDETQQLRLESDENLVQIVTIHKSKGLEYGVVYCPFLWQESEHKLADWFSCYDSTEAQAYLHATQLADDTAKQLAHAADKAEALRLLYVAVTRAKYHCSIALVTGLIDSNKFTYESALTWLLFGDLPNAQTILGKPSNKAITPAARQQAMHARLQTIVTAMPQFICHETLVADAPLLRYQAPQTQQIAMRRVFQQRLPPVPRVGSFSGLTAGKEDERPDYDFLAWQTAPAYDTTRTAFPRGTQAGSCLHKMLEELDFTQPLAAQQDVLRSALQRHGLAERWLSAGETLLTNALQTPLFTPENHAHALRLGDLSKQQRLDELEFYFPVTHLALEPLKRVLHRFLPPTWEQIHNAIDKLKFNTLTGFMKGYIDLIFIRNGQYYIVDYKSNELGETFADYTPDNLLNAMAEHHYYLQYLIYALALHRYLKQRVADYDWDTHAGGVLYLFLRGMNPAHAASGVFFHKPEAGLLDALDLLMS